MKTRVFLFISAIALSVACTKDNEPEPFNEEELITTVNLYFINGTDTVTFQYRDLDGDGGNNPVITSAALDAEASYVLAVELFNETESPAEDITEEIREEDEEHQFFYIPTTTLNMSVNYGDSDANSNPIGLINQVTTGIASTGQLRVVLLHEPNKDAAGVADGDLTNAGGETDIDITFDVDIQ